MGDHPLAAWTRPGRDPWDDMPALVDAPPLGGPSIPPPPGATFAGGGGDPMSTAFPGLGGGAGHTPAAGHNTHPNLPAWDTNAYTALAFSPYQPHYTNLPYPYSTHPYPPPPTAGGHYPPIHTPYQPHPHALPPWHGYPQMPFGTPAGPPPAHLPHPAAGAFPGAFPGHEGVYTPWAEGGNLDRGRQDRNWFAEGAERRARSQSVRRRRKKSKSPFAHGQGHGVAFPGFAGGGGDSYFAHDHDDEVDDNPWQRRGHGHGHGHGHEHGHGHGHGHGGATDWDALDNGFAKLSIGAGGGGRKGILKKRSTSFSGLQPPALHRRSISNPTPHSNPFYNGYHLTYEQHMQRNGLWGGREDELPYRPGSWRADYSVKGGGGMMGGLFRQNSLVKEINDTTKRTLHPHLLFDPTSNIPPISLDLRLDPRIPPTLAPALHLLTLPKNPHKLSQIDLLQFATQPPTSNMRLFHKRLPWYIDVVNQTGYVTVEDVISTLYHTLTGNGLGGKSQVTAAEYWCGEMGEHVEVTTPTPTTTPLLRAITPLPGMGGQKRPKHTAREQVSASWRIRGRLAYYVEWMDSLARGLPDELAQRDGAKAEKEDMDRGVRRVDWLAVGSNADDQRAFRWIGLRKGKRGMWEVVTEV